MIHRAIHRGTRVTIPTPCFSKLAFWRIGGRRWQRSCRFPARVQGYGDRKHSAVGIVCLPTSTPNTFPKESWMVLSQLVCGLNITRRCVRQTLSVEWSHDGISSNWMWWHVTEHPCGGSEPYHFKGWMGSRHRSLSAHRYSAGSGHASLSPALTALRTIRALRYQPIFTILVFLHQTALGNTPYGSGTIVLY